METYFESIKRFYNNAGTNKFIDFMFAASYVYVIWIAVHYLSAHMYTWWCVPPTVVGFVLAPFLVPAPHCTALRWAITTGGQQIIAMWALIGTWLFNLIMNYTVKDKNE